MYSASLAPYLMSLSAEFLHNFKKKFKSSQGSAGMTEGTSARPYHMYTICERKKKDDNSNKKQDTYKRNKAMKKVKKKAFKINAKMD